MTKKLKMVAPRVKQAPAVATAPSEPKFVISRPSALPPVPSAATCLQTLQRRLGRPAFTWKSAAGVLEVKYLKLKRRQVEAAFADLDVVEAIHHTGADWGCLHTGCWQYIGEKFRVRFRLRRYEHEVLFFIDTKFRTDEELAAADAAEAVAAAEKAQKDAERAAARAALAAAAEAAKPKPVVRLKLKTKGSS